MSDTEHPTPTTEPRTLTVPDLSLVVLIGASGSGKSTFAREHFRPTEILSSDAFRAWVSDEEGDQSATNDAFDALHHLAAIRLRRGKLVVIDATNVQVESRKPLLALAAEHDVIPVAIVLNVPERICQDRNRERPDRTFGPHVVRNQTRDLRQSLRNIRREGFRYVHVLNGPEEIASVQIERTRSWTDRRDEHGPFDIIGDIHGCYEELIELLQRLGYTVHPSLITHQDGRKAVFLGDLVDRGPGMVETARLVMAMVKGGTALCVPGNHDIKLMRWIQGRNVQVAHGLGDSIEQIERLPEEERGSFKRDFAEFVDALVSHFVLDDGKLVVAHAGMKEPYQGRASRRVRDFAIWGDTTGETDEFGLPIRYPWAEEYRGKATVVYGHTPVPEPQWLNNTINIDTGCVFGGRLTALRYPERETVQVRAKQQYAVPAKPIGVQEQVGPDSEHRTPNIEHLSAQWQSDELLRAEDVIGKRIVETGLAGRVTVRAENAAAALEVMSRFAVEPRWLIYLPPTMSPSETTSEEGYLEYPREAFAYFRNQGVTEVVCQTKHMGSRAVVVVCRDEGAARKRFGAEGTLGECYTRTGRRFFDDDALHRAFLEEVAGPVGRAGIWEELETDWICLDAELMPWNAKAQGLLRDQYAPVGAAAKLSLSAARDAVQGAIGRGIALDEVSESLVTRAEQVERYIEAYGRYCWPVAGLQDYRLAPFHLLATEGRTYFDRDHAWHVETLAKLADHSPLLQRTDSRRVDLTSDESEAEATAWWRDYTESGGEGIVVKPLAFVVKWARGLVQPAVKVRGREYLRIIYGPEYTDSRNLERLSKRGLSTKRSLAAREFALGVEGLDRFVRREPLRRVHECAFAVLALESEPVDPRL